MTEFTCRSPDCLAVLRRAVLAAQSPSRARRRQVVPGSLRPEKERDPFAQAILGVPVSVKDVLQTYVDLFQVSAGGSGSGTWRELCSRA